MPFTWDFQPPILVVTAMGAYTNEELVQAVESITRDPRFSAGLTVIFDGRLSKASLSREDIEWRVNALANDLWRRGFGRRMAFVVRSDQPARYGVGRMLQMMTESKGFEIEVFYDFDEAMKWGADVRETNRNDHPAP